MKKTIFIGFLAAFLVLGQNSLGQCNVDRDVTNNGNKYYYHAREKIYDNKDLQYGLLLAYAQLMIIQSPEDKNLLQFVMFIIVGKKDRQMVVPRQIEIYFTDGTSTKLMAESLENLPIVSQITSQQSTFILTKEDYLTLQEKSLSKIVIKDNREGNQLICTPYKDLLKEQANCIALMLN